jgi:hypothetical protein
LIQKVNFGQDIDKIKLVIYYLPFSIISDLSYNKDGIKKRSYYKVEVEGPVLSGYVNLIERLKKVDYSPIVTMDEQDYRLYCELFAEKQLIMTYGFRDQGDVIYIDDKVPIKYDDSFYQLVQPFIPKYESDFFNVDNFF